MINLISLVLSLQSKNDLHVLYVFEWGYKRKCNGHFYSQRLQDIIYSSAGITRVWNSVKPRYFTFKYGEDINVFNQLRFSITGEKARTMKVQQRDITNTGTVFAFANRKFIDCFLCWCLQLRDVNHAAA